MSHSFIHAFRIPLASAVAMVLAGLVFRASGQTASQPQPSLPQARVVLKDKSFRDVVLVEKQKDAIAYREPGGPANVTLSIPLASIESVEFTIQYEDGALFKAKTENNWTGVCLVLLPVVSPLLPYLDLPRNNAAGMTLETAIALMKSAAAIDTPAATEKEKARMKRLYAEARRLLKSLPDAEWFADADIAQLKAVQCLISMDEIKQAETEMQAVRVPEPGDASYGLYWLTSANLLTTQRKYRPALNAVVKSIDFENKDVETFPDALMLSGRLYEELQEPYRARDVYYEIARLFGDTPWHTEATNRLQVVVSKGQVKVKEKAAIESVFFGLDEDLNPKVDMVLRGESFDKAKSIESEQTIDDVVNSASEDAAKKAKEDEAAGKPAPPPPVTAPPPAAPPPSVTAPSSSSKSSGPKSGGQGGAKKSGKAQ